MKKKVLYVLLVMMLLGLPAVYANKPIINNAVLDKHYSWISLRGGYHTFLEQFDDINTLGGKQFGIGAGYELRYGWFYLSFGLDAAYWSVDGTTQPYHIERMMYDTQDKLMTYHYELSASTEHSYGINASVPILLGFNWNGLYVGAGASIGYRVLAQNQASRHYTGYATYDQYFEDFAEMPNHYYTEFDAVGKEALAMSLPVSFIAEVGYDVLYGYSYSSYSRDKVFKVGAYVEYGLLNAFNTKEDASLFDPIPEHPTQLNVYAYYNNKATSHPVIPISGGVKLTVMFRIPTRNCNCK